MKKTILTSIISALFLIVSAKIPDDPLYLDWNQNVHLNKELNRVASFPENKIAFLSVSNPGVKNDTVYRKNAVYFEFFGPGILYSVNCERSISPHLSLRAGFTSWTLHNFVFALAGIEKLSMTAFPVMVNYLTGPMKSSHLEIGAGVMPSFFTGKAFFTDSNDTERHFLLVGTASFGYRYQPPDGGFFFRAVVTPLFGQNIGYSGGLSFGYVF